MCRNVFNVWLRTTLLLPVRPRDSKRLETPALEGSRSEKNTTGIKGDANIFYLIIH